MFKQLVCALFFLCISSITQAKLIRVSDGFNVKEADLGSQTETVWNIAKDGQLLGAYNISVSNTLFDVEFVSYESVFVNGQFLNNYGGVAEIEVTTTQEYFNFSKALLSQVLLDRFQYTFDTDPDKTFGCDSDDCWIVTPFALDGFFYDLAIAINGHGYSNYSRDGTESHDSSWYSSQHSRWTLFADWTLSSSRAVNVPEPSAVALMLIGIAGMVVTRRKAYS